MKLEQTENVKVIADTIRSKDERLDSVKRVGVRYNRLKTPTGIRDDSPWSLKAKHEALLALLRGDTTESPKTKAVKSK